MDSFQELPAASRLGETLEGGGPPYENCLSTTGGLM